MAFATSGPTVLDPVVGIPVYSPVFLVTEDGKLLVPQVTGEPPSGLNTLPGTFTPLPAGQSVGLPYGFVTIPTTGPLT